MSTGMWFKFVIVRILLCASGHLEGFGGYPTNSKFSRLPLQSSQLIANARLLRINAVQLPQAIHALRQWFYISNKTNIYGNAALSQCSHKRRKLSSRVMQSGLCCTCKASKATRKDVKSKTGAWWHQQVIESASDKSEANCVMMQNTQQSPGSSSRS